MRVPKHREAAVQAHREPTAQLGPKDHPFPFLRVVLFRPVPQTPNRKIRSHRSYGKQGRGSCQPLATFSSTNPYVSLFNVCFCLKTLYLMCIIDSSALHSASSTIPQPERGRLTRVFLAERAASCAGTRRSAGTMPGAISNSEVTTQKHKNAKNVTPKKPQKRTLVSGETGRSPCSCWASAGDSRRLHGCFPKTRKAPRVWVWG